MELKGRTASVHLQQFLTTDHLSYQMIVSGKARDSTHIYHANSCSTIRCTKI